MLAYDQEVDGEEPEEQESERDEVEVTAMKSDSLPSRSLNHPVPSSSAAGTSQMHCDDRKRTYAFAPRDDKVSAKKPPGPCFVCGSKNHWKRECPHVAVYDAAQKAGRLKDVFVHAVDKGYEEQQQEFFLEMANPILVVGIHYDSHEMSFCHKAGGAEVSDQGEVVH